MRFLIADLVVEYDLKYDRLKRLTFPFIYNGDLPTDIRLKFTEESIINLHSKMSPERTFGDAEELGVSSEFNRAVLKFNTLFVHSSALVCNGKAYLFSADSGVGKSTHTRLWLKAFGDKVHIMNDDKPVVRIYDDRIIAYSTPFDGGSGIALNEAYPLGAIIFIERGKDNSIRVPNSAEIISNLFFSTAHRLGKEKVELMLNNFEKLIERTKFYILTCNMDISAAHFAYNSIIK